MSTPQNHKNLDGTGSVTPQSLSHADRFATSRPRVQTSPADTKEKSSNA